MGVGSEAGNPCLACRVQSSAQAGVPRRLYIGSRQRGKDGLAMSVVVMLLVLLTGHVPSGKCRSIGSQLGAMRLQHWCAVWILKWCHASDRTVQ